MEVGTSKCVCQHVTRDRVINNQLTPIDPARVKEIAATLPAEKRPAMSKALKAACQHLRDSRKNYAQAFELATAMVKIGGYWEKSCERLKTTEGVGHPKPVT